MNMDTVVMGVFLTLVAAAAIAGAYSFFRTPAPYIAFAKAIWKDAFPIIFVYLTKRMPKEKEDDFHRSVHRAEEWDNFRKRPREK